MTHVRIQSSFLLNERFELPSESLDDAVARYRKEWDKTDSDIISGIESVTELTFFPNVIDCYVANMKGKGQISNPLIVGGGYNAKEFVNALTHSLIHLIADDNEQNYNWHEVALKLWPQHEKFVAYHVMTNAIHEAVYTDVLNNTDLVIKLIEESGDLNRGDSHKEAWEIVEQVGYKKIIQDLKDNSYVTDKKFP